MELCWSHQMGEGGSSEQLPPHCLPVLCAWHSLQDWEMYLLRPMNGLQVICTTLSGALCYSMKGLRFKVTVVDETAQVIV